MRLLLCTMMACVMVCPATAQNLFHKDRFSLYAAGHQVGGDLEGLDEGAFVGIRFKGPQKGRFQIGVELEAGLSDSEIQLEHYSLNAVSEIKLFTFANLLLGAGLSQWEKDAWEEPGINLIAGFSAPVGKGISVFVRRDWWRAGESNYLVRDDLNVDLTKAGFYYSF